MFIYNDVVKIPDVDKNQNLTEAGLLRMLQEAANAASSTHGYGLQHMEKTQSTWVLLNWRLKFIEEVPFASKITIKTWAYFQKSLYSLRNFEVYVEDKLVAIADSKWVFVDFATHSIKKLSEDLMNLYGNEERSVFEEEFSSRLKLTETAEEKLTYNIMVRDLDQNHHVNNIAYVDIAKEVLPEELKTTHSKEFAAIYKKEIQYGDVVTCYYEKVEDEHRVFIYTKETNTLNCILIFK